MKEIEVKARMNDKELIIKKLTELGCVFEEPVIQKDTIYVRNMGPLETFLANEHFARIRTKSNGKNVFTVKKNVKGNSLAKEEYETEVASAEVMEKALILMGYTEAVRVNKTRVTTTYNGCEICIDEVENLGSFIEMEKMSEGDNYEEIQDELFAFLKSLGIREEDRVFKGYDILMLSK